MSNKMTNKKALAYVLNNASNLPDDVREKLENMLAALENKTSNGNRKLTKIQEENNVLRECILSFLSENPNLLVTCTDIGKNVPELDGMNNQKISGLMRALVDNGVVIKLTEKGKSLFQIAPTDESEEEEEESGE